VSGRASRANDRTEVRLSVNWRSRRYGKILGSDLEAILQGIRNSWHDGQEIRALLASDRASKFWGEIAKSPHWGQFYQLTFAQVVALMGQITGTIDLIVDAANSEYPSDLLVGELSSRLDASEPGDDPRTLPLVLTLIANLDSIARYSLGVNDLLRRASRNGCVESLARAASMDTGVLALPQAQLLMKSLQMSGSTKELASFLQAVAHGPHKTRLVYPELRWAEYLLRDQGAFDNCTQDEIHELIVVHLKLYDDDSKLKDSKKALFMLFRKWRKESGI
jgi:hypothetical protein